MAKDRTLQAIQSAVESGTLKAGASQLLNSYTPIPDWQDEKLLIRNTRDWDDEARAHVHINGLMPGNKLAVDVTPYTIEHLNFTANRILINYNDGEAESVEQENHLEVDNVRSIERIIVEMYSDDGGWAENFKELDWVCDNYETPEPLEVTAVNCYLDGRFLYGDMSSLNYRDLPITLIPRLPRGYHIKGWFKDSEAPENFISDAAELTLTEFDFWVLKLVLTYRE